MLEKNTKSPVQTQLDEKERRIPRCGKNESEKLGLILILDSNETIRPWGPP